MKTFIRWLARVWLRREVVFCGPGEAAGSGEILITADGLTLMRTDVWQMVAEKMMLGEVYIRPEVWGRVSIYVGGLEVPRPAEWREVNK